MRLALAGDTMLGRLVAETIGETRRVPFDRDVLEVAAEADLFVLNLECCISARGERWRSPGKPFFFRAPPLAAELLAEMGVDCVTLANNHALDYGVDALLDTFEHLRDAGVAWVGAGPDLATARAPHVLDGLAVIGASDHPAEYAARPDRPGIAYFGDWLADAVAAAPADIVLVTPHWGPNMTVRPSPSVEEAARQLVAAGATLVAGHSAHVFHGVSGRVLYDLGDFVDDYRVDPHLRNDLGLLFLVELSGRGPERVEAVPLKLEFCHTRLARGEDAAWIARRFIDACRELGTDVSEHDGRLVASLG